MKTLTELAQEIERRAEAKKDFVVPTTAMVMDESANLVFGGRTLPVNDVAHGQVASHVGIPKQYYDRMRTEAPKLLANNVNEWFAKYPADRMVRTLDGKTRAFLSDRYRPLENEDLAEAVLPVLMGLDLMPLRCEITDSKLYLKFVDRRIEKDIPKGKRMGDGGHTIFSTLSPAIVISNSEVGAGALSVATSVFEKACTNLSTFSDRSVRKAHLGRKHEITEGFEALLSDETRRLSDKALFAQIKDVVRAAFEEAQFKSLCDKISGAAQEVIEGDPVKVIERTARKYLLTEMVQTKMLKHFVEGGDLSRWGVASAMTRTAQDVEDPDLANDMERYGGHIIDLPKNDWKELALAA